MPVESIYRSRRRDAGGKGSYCDDSALYMRDLIARLGLSLPGEYATYPDHLALELDMLAVLQRSGCAHEARSFSAERFGWLPDYRRQLARLADDAAVFYIALIDVLIASTDAGGLCGRCDTDLRADSGGAPAAGVRPCPVRPM